MSASRLAMVHHDIGCRRWAISAGRAPSRATGAEPMFSSRDQLALLNAGIELANVRMRVLYAGHGPVGLICDDIEASHARALACGARALTGLFEAAGVRIAMLEAPQGHAIELIQLPA